MTTVNNQFCIIRSDRAGVFFAKVKERNGDEVTLTDARRIWYWSGATDTLQLATEGVSEPSDCKFTVTVPEMVVLGVIEIIPCSDTAIKIIKAVPEWRE